jgi:hypothetical protein
MRWLRFILFSMVFISLIFPQSINIEVPQSSCDNQSDLALAITNLPRCTAESFLSSITDGLIFASNEFFSISMTFLTASPDIKWFCSPYNSIMAILESFYSVMLMGLGGYYIINSTDVEGRTKAKIWLKNVFFMVILLSFSFSIFGMILDLNTQISSSVYSSVSSSIFQIDAQLSNIVFSLIFALSLTSGAYLTFVTLLSRYLLIPFMLFLFPIAIFLYFIPLTREWGAFLFKFIILIIFMTSVDAIFLLGTSYLFSAPDPNLAGSLIKSFGLIVGFGLIGILNLIIYIIAILSVVMQAIKAFESIISLLMRIAIMLTFL